MRDAVPTVLGPAQSTDRPDRDHVCVHNPVPLTSAYALRDQVCVHN